MKPLIFIAIAGILLYLAITGKADGVIKGLFAKIG